MINRRLVEDVVCPVDDMKKSDYPRAFVQRGGTEGRENKGPRYRRRKPLRQDIDAGDVARQYLLGHVFQTPGFSKGFAVPALPRSRGDTTVLYSAKHLHAVVLLQ